MMHKFVFVLLAVACVVSQSDIFAVDSCEGVYSPGNPYPCCSHGNCTWWAWAVANDGRDGRAGWDDRLPAWGPFSDPFWGDLTGAAKYWLANAQRTGQDKQYGTRANPARNTIAVASYDYGCGLNNPDGHVAWVTDTNGYNLTVTEMGCEAWPGWRTNPRYTTDCFDGFIYPRPKVASMYPPIIRAGGGDQRVTLYGGNFQNDPNTVVLVTFPGGGQVYLSGVGPGGQIPSIVEGTQGSMDLLVTFGGPGSCSNPGQRPSCPNGCWCFQVQNFDGGWSDPFAFSVY